MRWMVVDGIDGSGKSTIGKMICDHYRERGETTHMLTHPSDRFFGRISRQALQGRGGVKKIVAATFYILDVLISVGKLRGLKSRYQNLVFVRYLMGTAYLPSSLARRGYKFFCKFLPVPERLLLVDIDPEVALTRISSRDDGREMFEDLDSLVKVRNKVMELAAEGWEIVDNSGSQEETRSGVEEIIDRWDREEVSRSSSS